MSKEFVSLSHHSDKRFSNHICTGELEDALSAERQEMREHAQTNVARPTNVTANLPAPDILAVLVNLFFNRIPGAHLVVDRNNLVQNLSLPRDHRNFPAASILHAICAVAGLFVEGVLPGLQATQSRALQGLHIPRLPRISPYSKHF